MGSVIGFVRFRLPVCRLSWFLHVEHICTFFVTFFSATIDGRDLIFDHKFHIGIPYRGKRFGPIRFLLPVCRLCRFLYTLNIHFVLPIFSRIFPSNYWWQKYDIWSQASYRYPISWQAFFDLSDSYFLCAEERRNHKWAVAQCSSCFKFPTNSTVKACKIWCNDVYMYIRYCDIFCGN